MSSVIIQNPLRLCINVSGLEHSALILEDCDNQFTSIVPLINYVLNEKREEDIYYNYVINEKREEDINCCAINASIIRNKHLSFSFYRSNKIYPERLSFSASNATH